MNFCTLASGSNGNASVLSAGEQHILIDAGISNRAICTALSALDIAPNAVSALLITHEHSDHIRGLAVWARQHPECRLFAPEECAQALCAQNPALSARMHAFSAGDSFCVGDVRVRTVKTPHDTPVSVGYCMEHAGRRVVIATDLGYVPDALREMIASAALLLIEANYDEKKLQYGRYPLPLKHRIMSERGHLSNADCADCVLEAARRGVRYVLLGHLSAENNTPRLAYETVHRRLLDAGIIPGVDMQLQVAPRGMRGEPVTLDQEEICSQFKSSVSVG